MQCASWRPWRHVEMCVQTTTAIESLCFGSELHGLLPPAPGRQQRKGLRNTAVPHPLGESRRRQGGSHPERPEFAKRCTDPGAKLGWKRRGNRCNDFQARKLVGERLHSVRAFAARGLVCEQDIRLVSDLEERFVTICLDHALRDGL